MTTRFSPTSARLGLPGRYYTDPDCYQRELKTVWRSTWQWVGRLEDLAGPGDYLTTILGEEPIFVVKNAEGELLAMHNVCPHRGRGCCLRSKAAASFCNAPTTPGRSTSKASCWPSPNPNGFRISTNRASGLPGRG